MKKIFSILVTTMLLAGMMLPMAVSAADVNSDTPTVTIAADGETNFLIGGKYGDDFTLYSADGTSQGSKTASAGYNSAGASESTSATYPERGNFLYFNIANAGAGAYMELPLPVSVEAAGNYNVTVYSSHFVTTELVIDGTTYEASSVEVHSNDTFYAQTTITVANKCRINYFTVPLTTDTTEIKLKFTSTQSSTFALAFDNVLAEKVASEEPDEPEDPVIPFEKVDPDGNTPTVSIAATGQTWMKIGGNYDDDFVLYTRQWDNATQSNTFTSSTLVAGSAAGTVVTGFNNAGANIENTAANAPERGNYLYYTASSLTGSYVELKLPVSVNASGLYDVTVYASSTVTTQMIIDGVTYDATSTVAHSNTSFFSQHSGSGLRCSINTFENLPLTTGTQGVTVRFTTVQNTFALGFDDLYFEKVAGDDEPDFSYELNADGTGSVSYSASVADSITGGTAIVAYYNGQELVAVKDLSANADRQFVMSDTVSGFDKAKFFIWDSKTNCVPMIDVIEMTAAN